MRQQRLLPFQVSIGCLSGAFWPCRHLQRNLLALLFSQVAAARCSPVGLAGRKSFKTALHLHFRLYTARLSSQEALAPPSHRGARPRAQPAALQAPPQHHSMSADASLGQQQIERANSNWPPVKTALRGVSHAHALFAALAAGIMLVLAAPGRREKLACAAYVGEFRNRTHSAAGSLALSTAMLHRIIARSQANARGRRVAGDDAHVLDDVPSRQLAQADSRLAAATGSLVDLRTHCWLLHAVLHACSGGQDSVAADGAACCWLSVARHAGFDARMPPACWLAVHSHGFRALQYLEWGGALVGMLINLFWLSAPKPLKTTIYIGLGWLVRHRHSPVLSFLLLLSSNFRVRVYISSQPSAMTDGLAQAQHESIEYQGLRVHRLHLSRVRRCCPMPRK